MWQHPRRGTYGFAHTMGLEGRLVIEGNCVLVIDDSGLEQPGRRTMLLLPDLVPHFRTPPLHRSDDHGRGFEHAIAWLPTLYDEESQSLWVGRSDRIKVGDKVVASFANPIDTSDTSQDSEKMPEPWPPHEQYDCDADDSWLTDYIEHWP